MVAFMRGRAALHVLRHGGRWTEQGRRTRALVGSLVLTAASAVAIVAGQDVDGAPTWRACVQGALAARQDDVHARPPFLLSRHASARADSPDHASASIDYASLSRNLAAWKMSVEKIGQHQHACPGRVQPTLVFSPAGGFADRLRGAVTAFYAALLTHARFQVAWTAPSALADYFDVDPAWLWTAGDGVGGTVASEPFQPGIVQARIPGAAVVRAVDEVEYVPFFGGDFVSALAPPSDSNFSSIIFVTNAPAWLTVVRHSSLRSTADSLGLSGLARRQLFVLALYVLLRRPSENVVAGLQDVFTHHHLHHLTVRHMVARSAAFGGGGFGSHVSVRRGSKRRSTWRLTHSHLTPPRPPPAIIGVQIRTGGVGEAWTDSRLRHPVDSARCFADRARAVCASVYGGACVVYLAADAAAAAAVFERHINGSGLAVVRAAGPSLHTDRPLVEAQPSAPTGDPWLKTHVDWVALGLADVLLTSHGGFGWTAAWAGGVPVVQQLRLGGEAGCAWVDFDGCAELPA